VVPFATGAAAPVRIGPTAHAAIDRYHQYRHTPVGDMSATPKV
jgi:hypothetical protein